MIGTSPIGGRKEVLNWAEMPGNLASWNALWHRTAKQFSLDGNIARCGLSHTINEWKIQPLGLDWHTAGIEDRTKQ